MRTDHDILKVTKRMVADLNCTFSDLASTINRQQSALTRSLDHNPTVRLLQEVAWALGLGVDPETGKGTPEYCWLCLPFDQYVRHVNYSFRLNFQSPMVRHSIAQRSNKLTRHATWGRGPDYDPTDKGHLSEVYPGKALEGAGGAPIDSRFIEAPQPEPLHGKTSQGPGGAQRVASMQDLGRAMQGHDKTAQQDLNLSGHRHNKEGGLDRVVAAPINEEPFEQRQARLSEGAPAGYRLSAKALADAPRTPLSKWLQGGWDVERMIEHGYLEVDPAFDKELIAKAQEQLTGAREEYTNPTEQRRVEASYGAPDGWILSDRAMEIEGVTYDKLVEAMGLDKMKADRFLVPKAWLGHA